MARSMDRYRCVEPRFRWFGTAVPVVWNRGSGGLEPRFRWFGTAVPVVWNRGSGGWRIFTCGLWTEFGTAVPVAVDNFRARANTKRAAAASHRMPATAPQKVQAMRLGFSLSRLRC